MAKCDREQGACTVRETIDRKRQVIDKNRRDFAERLGRASDTAQKIFTSAQSAIHMSCMDEPLVPRHIVVWSSDDHEPRTVRLSHVVEALLLLRHPAIGYKGLLRRTTVHGPGRPIYRIWYRHDQTSQ